jgi:hypothetical protein
LIGFAYDGFPIYGAYGYKNPSGTGGIVRMKSSYQLRAITVRTHDANGNDVTDGPPISTTYPLGYFREDYQYVLHTNDSDYLDDHNGRFCITPEYPNGTYAYFATVDENWNSAYPYAVGPTFYGVYANRKVTSVTEATNVYTPSTTGLADQYLKSLSIGVFPNPVAELLAIQVNDIVRTDLELSLLDNTGKTLLKTTIHKGQTIGYFDLQTVYAGNYFISISNGTETMVRKLSIQK